MSTTKGKKYALDKLAERRQANAQIVKKDNGALRAGSPMYYYCKACNHEMVLPETHTCPVPQLCDECQALKDCGWLE